MKNTLLITADSLRADYCGFLGGPDTTPFLSTLSEDSVVYENAISPGPRTPSSIALSMTGERFRTNPDKTNEGRLERIADHVQRFETIPESFADQGYSTAAVTANPWTTTATGFDELFDEFIEIGGGYGNDENSTDRSVVGRGLDYIEQWRKGTDWFAQWPSFYNDIQRLIDTMPEPWFLWIFLLDTHSPYILPRNHLQESNTPKMMYSALRYNTTVMRGKEISKLPPHVDKYLKQTYRDAIRSVDQFVKRIYEETPDGTNLLFHSDHGEAFGEHGTYGHKEQLYEENIHVPLLFYDGEESDRVEKPVSTIDIPTLLIQAADGDMNPKSITDSVVFSQTEFGDARAARTKQYKFIQNNEASNLYDLRRSAKELKPIEGQGKQVFNDAIQSEFSTDIEKSNIVEAVRTVSL